MSKAHTSIRVRDDRDWRALWRDVLARSRCSPDVLPMNALCWALEQLALAGFELPRVVLFVQTIWSRFARTLGEQKPRIAPTTEEPKPPPLGASRREREQYERELEKQIADAQKELEHARSDYAHFCELVNVARSAFGDAQGFLVNVLGWALQVLYRRGYSDDELAGLVEQTWGVVEQQRRERASSSSSGPPHWRDVLERATTHRTHDAQPRDGVACPLCGWSDPVQGARQGCGNCARWAAASAKHTEPVTQARVTPRTRRR